jgi:osmotically-inducible protein OsmY
MSKAQLVRGAVIGAGLMYFFDPVLGARRRADLAGRISHVLRLERELFERARRDAENRIRGLIEQVRAPVTPVSDEVLEPRVRAKLGHCVSHARAVLVDVVDGHVTLAGPILANEADHLVSEVAAIRGVK